MLSKKKSHKIETDIKIKGIRGGNLIGMLVQNKVDNVTRVGFILPLKVELF